MAYISAAESIRVSSTTFTQSAQKATRVGEIKQPLGPLRRSRSFKVIELGTNRKPICDFLLVINSNSPPILHRFQDIASQRSKIATFFLPLFGLIPPPPTEGFPCDDLRQILPGCRQVTKVLNGTETLPKISIGWVGCMNVTDGQTDDRQTDGRRHIANVNSCSRSLKAGRLAIDRFSPERRQKSTPTKHDGRAVLFAIAELLVSSTVNQPNWTYQPALLAPTMSITSKSNVSYVTYIDPSPCCNAKSETRSNLAYDV